MRRTGRHVLDESGEEGLGLEVGVVLLEVGNGSVNHLERNQFESSLLESTLSTSSESFLLLQATLLTER